MSNAQRPYSHDNDDSDHGQALPSDERADLLMSRIIDGVASERDQREFEQLADAQPHLWRELALRQRDAAALAAHVGLQFDRAARIDLPATAHARETLPFPLASRRHGGWIFASAGWAAALAMLLLWWLVAPMEHGPPTNGRIHVAVQTTPEEQLRSYLRSPFVVGELDPVMERVDELPDGRVAVVALRRIQEVIFLDDDDPLPVDEDLRFIKDPAELRLVRK